MLAFKNRMQYIIDIRGRYAPPQRNKLGESKMFMTATKQVLVDDAVLHLPLQYRYVLVGKDGSVRAFKSRPVLKDEKFNIWGSDVCGNVDLGILLGSFYGNYTPRLIKFAEHLGHIETNSRGWVVKEL